MDKTEIYTNKTAAVVAAQLTRENVTSVYAG